MNEFEFKGKQFEVFKRKGFVLVKTDDFIATSRQLEILSLRAHGFQCKKIAEQLNVSKDTIKNILVKFLDLNEDLTGLRENVTVLTVRASKYELLSPVIISSLHSYKK